MPKAFVYILFASLLLLIFSISFVTSTDLTQDLGRHIRIGQMIVEERTIPSTNLFSYTHPDFPFINHHWLSEVIFYGLSALLGLKALNILKVLLIIGSCLIVYVAAVRLSGVLIATATSALLVPLLVERMYIRPELFGYFLFASLIYILFSFPGKPRLLYAIAPIMLLWVNLHITFIFGLGMVGLIGLSYTLIHKKIALTRETASIVGGGLAAACNPHGIQGLLYPFQIFDNYGYTIVENQHVFFLNDLMMNPHIKYLFALTLLVVVAMVMLALHKRLIALILLAVFWFAAYYQIRHMPFFVIAAVVPISLALRLLVRRIPRLSRVRLVAGIGVLGFTLTVASMYLSNWFYHTYDLNRSFGIRVYDEGAEAAAYMRDHVPEGAIFNNFDIGGYAIYTLYPHHTVFIDNRPEAYPQDFIRLLYIPLHGEQNLRRQVFEQYDIRTVFFSHTDQTPWGMSFMAQILADREWNLVYMDNLLIILEKNSRKEDIRTHPDYLEKLLTSQTNYLSLLKLSKIFSLMNRPEFAERAYQKADEINPGSCAIKRGIVGQYANTTVAAKAQPIQREFWYCFL